MTSPENMSELGKRRRSFLQNTLRLGAPLLAAIGYSSTLNQLSDPLRNTQITRPEELGTTFSQVQCRDLGLDPKETFIKVLNMGFDVIRIGTYMDEISRQGLDFTDWMIKQAEDREIPLIVTVGLKAPRYPEFFPDEKIKTRLNLAEIPGQTIGTDDLTFQEVISHVKSIVAKYKERTIIKGWQVENEAEDRLNFAGSHSIFSRLFDEEAKAAKEGKSPKQEIYFSNAFNIPDSDENLLRNIRRNPSGIGFNIYYRIPNPNGGYYQLKNDDFKKLAIIADLLNRNNITPSIFESQAEPWEDGAHIHLSERYYPSSNPDIAVKLASKLTQVGFRQILLWGCEYWIYRENIGQTEWMDAMRSYLSAAKIQRAA